MAEVRNMIFTLTDRDYNPLDVYETTDYLIGVYTGYVTKSLEMSVLTDSTNSGLWDEGNYILCKDKEGYQYWFTIYKSDDSLNGSKRELQCYSGSLDIMNEDATPIHYPSQPLSFSDYFNKVFGGDSGITIGINEIAGMKRSLEFTSENASIVEMIQYILNGFDNAEGDFVVDVEGSVVKSIKLNVFKRIGKVEHQDIITDDNDSLISLDRTGSIEELATAIKPYTQQSDNTELTLIGKEYKETDPDTGEILYISEKNSPHIKSRKAHKNYFVNLENKATGDNGYIVRRYSSQAKTQDALWTAGLTKLKEIDHPIFKYEVKGASNAKIGDNVQIISKKMKPSLYLEARLMELKFNDDIPNINEYTFGNYKTLESNLNTIDKWLEEIKKQIITIIPPIEVLYAASDQGVDPPETGWIASIPFVAPGMYLWSKAITTFSNGDKSTSYVSSRQGENGEDGDPGKDGDDGQTPYLHVAYANSEDGSKDFSTTVSKDKEYIGSYTDYLPDASTDYRKYKWMKVKGDPGLQQYLHIAYANSEDGTKDFSITVSLGKSYIGQYNDFSAEDSQDPSKYKWSKWKGDPGENAEQVFAGYVTNQAMVLASTAGGIVTDYTTAKGTFNVTSGNVPVVNNVTFSVVQQSNMKITIDTSGAYQVTELNADNGSAILKAVYEGLSVQVVVVASKSKQGPQGSQGTPGETGADGKPVYIHIAYANSADGKTGFSLTDSNRLYVGQYVDNSAVNSTDPTKYKWSKIKGEDGTQGAPGAKGEDGRTPYFHTAWANSVDGRTDFSTNDPTGRAYLGSYSDFTQADSTDPTKYYWSKIKGEQGDGAYVHNAWAWSADGQDRFTDTYPRENIVLLGKDEVPVVGMGKDNQGFYPWLVASNNAWVDYELQPGDRIAVSADIDVQGPLVGTIRLQCGNPWMSILDVTELSGLKVGTQRLSAQSAALTNNSPIINSTNRQFGYRMDNVPVDTTVTYSNVKLEIIRSGEAVKNTIYTTPPSEDFGNAYPTYSGTYTDYNTADSTDPAKYTWARILGESGEDGNTGPAGSPTGITKSDTVPTGPYAGMLWQCTSASLPSYTKDAIYRWNGSTWELFIFTAVNIIAESLSALSANLGNITSGNITGATIKGSSFVNPFTATTDKGEDIAGNINIKNGYVESRYKYNAAGDNGLYKFGPDSISMYRHDNDATNTDYGIIDTDGLWILNRYQNDGDPNWHEQDIRLSKGTGGLSAQWSKGPNKSPKDGEKVVYAYVNISTGGIGLMDFGSGYSGSITAKQAYWLKTTGQKLHTSMPGGAHLTANQTFKPSRKLSECLNGWILEFQGYKDGVPSGGDFSYCPIPKVHGQNNSGKVMSLIVVGHGGSIFRKIVYVSDDSFTGHANNSSAPANTAVYTNTYSY